MPEEDEPEVIRDRRKKLERLRAAGVDPYSRGFKPTHSTAEARTLLGEGERTEPVALAGRLMVKRLMGGSVFADLQAQVDAQLALFAKVKAEDIADFNKQFNAKGLPVIVPGR